MMFSPVSVNALEDNHENISIVYLDDGSYYEIIINEEPSLTRASSKSGSKTARYYNASGVEKWYVTVKGTFSYNGSSSSCTSSSVSAGVRSSEWQIYSKNSSRSGNSAIATATATLYYNGNQVDIKIKTVTLTCSAIGTLG